MRTDTDQNLDADVTKQGVGGARENRQIRPNLTGESWEQLLVLTAPAAA